MTSSAGCQEFVLNKRKPAVSGSLTNFLPLSSILLNASMCMFECVLLGKQGHFLCQVCSHRFTGGDWKQTWVDGRGQSVQTVFCSGPHKRQPELASRRTSGYRPPLSSPVFSVATFWKPPFLLTGPILLFKSCPCPVHRAGWPWGGLPNISPGSVFGLVR